MSDRKWRILRERERQKRADKVNNLLEGFFTNELCSAVYLLISLKNLFNFVANFNGKDKR